MINWFLGLGFTEQLFLAFIAGSLVASYIMTITIYVKNKRMNAYKRQLEKEAISSDENAAKVKVLEQKIEVLEKALENALQGK
jgi:hypothetical protein